jgi:hypothetical protein
VLAVSVCPSAHAQEWNPPTPESDGKDWVQLKSGEWVRGTIEVFRDLKMEFDSDELDDLVLDWEDITAFRTGRAMIFVFSREQIYTGMGLMEGRIITIRTIENTIECDRRELLSIIQGGSREIQFWSIKANTGLTMRSGNSDQQDFSAKVDVKREGKRSRLQLDYRGDITRIAGERTVDKHTGGGDLDLFLSRRFYVTLADIEIYSDKFQNIDYRTTGSAGVGYFFFRQSKIDWSIGLSAGYQSTFYLSVEEGEDGRKQTFSMIPSTALDADITKNIEVELDYKAQIGIPDPKNSIHSLSGLISLDIYRDIFELTFSATWDRVENPAPYEDGTVPKRDDVKLIFGFGIDL